MLAQGQITVVTSEATPITVTAVNTDSSAPGTPTVITVVQGPSGDADPTQENDKKAIVRHPLFPLLASLFEKCERATQAPDSNSSDSFDLDIQDFVQRQEKQQNPFFSDDPDLDSLMVKAIQVLRIHLLELEKVNDLCKDFCSRYISCLKGKMHSENLLRTEGAYDPTTMVNPIAGLAGIASVVTSSGLVGSGAGNGVVVQQQNLATQPAVSMSSLGQGQIVSGGTVYQMVQTPQGIVAQPIQFQSSTPVTSSQVIHGSTPMSQIGVNTPTSQPSTPTVNTLGSVTAFTTSPDDDDDDPKRKTKRGVLPKLATEVMKSWLFQHIVHPYPTEDEKRQIAGQTNLTLLQVNNWFINARRRILQPMLDASTPDQVKSKKVKPQSKPADRFWPESLATLQPQIPTSVSPPAESRSSSHITLSRVEPDQHSCTTSTDDEDNENQAKKMLEIMSAGVSGLHPILVPMQPIITADGQIITTANLAAHLAAYQSPLALTTTSSIIPSHTIVIENGAGGEENIQNTSLSSGLDLSHEDVNSEDSESDASLVD